MKEKLRIIFTCPASGREHHVTQCISCFKKNREEASQDPNWNDPVADGRAQVYTLKGDPRCEFCGE